MNPFKHQTFLDGVKELQRLNEELLNLTPDVVTKYENQTQGPTISVITMGPVAVWRVDFSSCSEAKIGRPDMIVGTSVTKEEALRHAEQAVKLVTG